MLHVLNSVITKMKTSEGVLFSFHQGNLATYRYSEVYEHVLSARACLFNHGIRAGDSVGVLAENSYEWIVLDLACISLGAVLVPFDPKVKNTWDVLVEHYNLSLLFHDKENSTENPCFLTLSSLLEHNKNLSEDKVPFYQFNDNSIVCMKFTSGTTSTPKGIPAQAKNIDDCVCTIQSSIGHSSDDRILSFLPLYLLQQRYFIYSSIYYNLELIVVPYIYAFSSIPMLSPTVVMAVPHFLETLMDRYRKSLPDTTDIDITDTSQSFNRVFGSRLRYLWTGSAPISTHLMAEFFDIGIPVYQGYGTAETGILTKNLPGHNRFGSVGRVLPGREVIIADSGEIYARAIAELNTHYCDGNINNKASQFINDDGYFHTGDLGYLDDDGFLFITGRIKNMIVLPNGRKINPEPIEKLIEAHKDIHACILYSGPTGRLVAVINTSLRLNTIDNYLSIINTKLSSEELVSGFISTDMSFTQEAGFRNAQGKIVRDNIYAAFADRLQSDVQPVSLTENDLRAVSLVN